MSLYLYQTYIVPGQYPQNPPKPAKNAAPVQGSLSQYYTQNAAGAYHAAGFFYVLKTVVLAKVVTLGGH